jgi:hypothetical protein
MIMEVAARLEMILGVVDLLMVADQALQETVAAGVLHLAQVLVDQATILLALALEGLVTVLDVKP